MVGGNLVYLFVAYTVVWIVLFGYMFFLSQQVGDLRAQLNAFRRRGEAPKAPVRPPRGGGGKGRRS